MYCTHTDHAHDHRSMMTRVELACAERGLRFTDLRRRVFELIVDSQKPVKAYDLLEHVRRHGTGPAAPPTVYRALDFLVTHGFVHKLEALNAFVPCPHPDAGHGAGQFLICERCHSVVEFDADVLADRIVLQAQAQGFAVRRHVVEVYGLCAACRS